MKEKYQGNLVGKNEEKEKLFRFYNSLKTTQEKCNWGAKNCETCKVKECTMRQYLI